MKSPGLPPGMNLNHLFDNPHANVPPLQKKIASPFSSVITLSCGSPENHARFYCRNSLPDEWFFAIIPIRHDHHAAGIFVGAMRLKAMQFGWSKNNVCTPWANADGRELTHQAVRLLAYLSEGLPVTTDIFVMRTVEVRIESEGTPFSRNKIKAYASGLNHVRPALRGLATVGCRDWQRASGVERIGFH